MAKGYVFPGQASQFPGMGSELHAHSAQARELFSRASDLLEFDITQIMLQGTEEQLRETRVTQPAVFLHSVITAEICKPLEGLAAVAGHSLGEFSALVVAGALSFDDGLLLVKQRAEAMQKACEAQPGTMAAIVGMADDQVEKICMAVDGVVVAANYNCPGQLVISGESTAILSACKMASEEGALKAIPLAVGGAFHSPLMQPAREALQLAIEETPFKTPSCPVFQNVDGQSSIDPAEIKTKLIAQLTSPVRWTTTIENMIATGIDEFVEVGGTGKVLRGMIRRIDRKINTTPLQSS